MTKHVERSERIDPASTDCVSETTLNFSYGDILSDHFKVLYITAIDHPQLEFVSAPYWSTSVLFMVQAFKHFHEY